MTEKQKRVQKAKDMFLSGYNCAQSTAAPFHDLVGMDEKTIIKASSVFGGGVARMHNVCGVVSGIALLIGLSSSDIDINDADSKSDIYIKAQEVMKLFSDENGTVICSELLEEFEKNPLREPYRDKPCLKLVEDGAKILCGYFGIK